jgi:hypothetical protein
MKKQNLDERHALIGELKNLIKSNLEFCDKKSTPYLCEYKSTPKGYADIEEFVIKAFFETNMSVSDALVQKENILNPNYLTD